LKGRDIMKDKCEAFRALIPQYAAGELDAKAYAKLQRHISKCPDCSALLDAQLESMDGSGKLYILGHSIENAIKKSGKRKAALIGTISAASLIAIIIIAAIFLRMAGFVRIASVEVNDLSLEYVQEKHSDMLINETDLSIASKATIALEEFLNQNPDTHYSRFRFSMESDEVKDIGFAGGNIGNETSRGSLIISYRTTFYTYLLNWDPSVEPGAEDIGKTRFARFKIFDLIKETRYINYGNKRFEKYTATLDLWGTLTRQELN